MRPATRLELDLTGELVLGYALQAVTCIVIGLLLAHFARRRGLSHLRWWAGSWGILLVYVAIAALSLSSYFRMHLPATDWRRVFLSTLTLMAGLLQPAWMAIGTWEGMCGTDPSPAACPGCHADGQAADHSPAGG